MVSRPHFVSEILPSSKGSNMADDPTYATITQLDAVTASVSANADAIEALGGVVSTNAGDADAAWLVLCGAHPTKVPLNGKRLGALALPSLFVLVLPVLRRPKWHRLDSGTQGSALPRSRPRRRTLDLLQRLGALDAAPNTPPRLRPCPPVPPPSKRSN